MLYVTLYNNKFFYIQKEIKAKAPLFLHAAVTLPITYIYTNTNNTTYSTAHRLYYCRKYYKDDDDDDDGRYMSNEPHFI